MFLIFLVSVVFMYERYIINRDFIIVENEDGIPFVDEE